ncbi:DUF6233 domain-containing protein [Streptomyces sp. 7R007]
MGAERRPLQIHAGDCHMTGSRRRPVSRDEARRLLTGGLRACTHCRPDVQLDVIGLSRANTAGRRRLLAARRVMRTGRSRTFLRAPLTSGAAA